MSEDKKSERIFIRVSPEEKKKLEAQAEQANMTVSQYILKSTENKKIVVIENIPKLFVEITRIGVNINQIAHVANAQKYVNTRQIYEIQNLLKEVDKHMMEIIKALDNYDEDDVRTLDKKMRTLESDMLAMEQRMSLLERNFDEAFCRMDMKLDKIISAQKKRVGSNGSS